MGGGCFHQRLINFFHPFCNYIVGKFQVLWNCRIAKGILLYSRESITMASLMHESLSPQEIADMEEEWKEERLKLTLWQKPGRTLYLFFAAACKCTNSTIRYIVSHPVMLRFLSPLFVLWFVLEFVPGPYTKYIDNIEFCFEYIVWWVGLGILSSIGLGSGLQTGVLFLFPHIMRVCLTAQTCKSINFKRYVL